MRIVIVLSCILLCGPTLRAQTNHENLPTAVIFMLNQRFPGWKFAEVSAEVKQFFKVEMKGDSPVAITGDFDGNGRTDRAVLIRHGHYPGQPQWSRYYLVVFLRRNKHYKMHVIKEPNGEYIGLARKGTHDYNYDLQKEITYANDAIFTGIFEKGGSSYVYWKGRFRSFISSD